MYSNWHFYDRAVPNDLTRRGVLNSTLKYYPYRYFILNMKQYIYIGCCINIIFRDYGLKLWNTIQYAIECIIMKLYKSKHSIREDTGSYTLLLYKAILLTH